jgi:hypothetical protein
LELQSVHTAYYTKSITSHRFVVGYLLMKFRCLMKATNL